MNENTCVSQICRIMDRNIELVRKVIENIVKTKVNIKSYRQNNSKRSYYVYEGAIYILEY